MASVLEALVTMLTGNAALVAALSAGADGIYPIRFPQGAGLPAITFMLISDKPSYTLGGNAKLTDAYIQLSLFASTFTEVDALDKKVADAIDAFRGTASGVDIQMVSRVDASDIPEDEPHETGAEIYHRVLDYQITYAT